MAGPYWGSSFDYSSAYSPSPSMAGQPGPYRQGYAYPTALGGSGYGGGTALSSGGASSGALGGWGQVLTAVSDYMNASNEARQTVNAAKQNTKEIEQRADENRKTAQYQAQVQDWEVAKDRHERFDALKRNWVDRARANPDPRYAGTNALMNYNSLNTPQAPGARPAADQTYDTNMRPRG